MTSNDIVGLRERAQGGDPGAMTALGKRLVMGEGVRPAPEEGFQLISNAAAKGDAEAHAQLAVFAAFGALRTRSVEAALAHLEMAAALGHGGAQAQLRLLARDAGDDWAFLRTHVDAIAWMSAPAPRVLLETPRVRAVEGFASGEECDWLIELARGSLRRAMIYRREAAGLAETQSRTNSEADYTIANADIVLALLRERIATAVGIETRFFEVAKLLHYTPGQEFATHADFVEPTTPALAEDVRLHGQRVATFLLYLNESYEGGETHFVHTDLRFKGKRGDALFFFNTTPAGALDYQSLHAGLPTTRGEKWLFSQWIRDKAFG